MSVILLDREWYNLIKDSFSQILDPLGFSSAETKYCNFWRKVSDDIYHLVMPVVLGIFIQKLGWVWIKNGIGVVRRKVIFVILNIKICLLYFSIYRLYKINSGYEKSYKTWTVCTSNR